MAGGHCVWVSVQFSHLVVTDSLWPHGLQHIRPLCLSSTPRACSNSCPSSWWFHPTISSSVVPFSSCLQSSSASGSFPMSQFFKSGGQRIRLQCGRPGFDSWVGKIPWRREYPTPVFWPRESHGLYSPWGHKVCMSLILFKTYQLHWKYFLEYFKVYGITHSPNLLVNMKRNIWLQLSVRLFQ